MRCASLLALAVSFCASCDVSVSDGVAGDVRVLLQEAWADGFDARTHFMSNGINPRDYKIGQLTQLWDTERANFLKQHRQAGTGTEALVDFQVKAYQAGFLGESQQSALDGLLVRAVRAISK